MWSLRWVIGVGRQYVGLPSRAVYPPGRQWVKFSTLLWVLGRWWLKTLGARYGYGNALPPPAQCHPYTLSPQVLFKHLITPHMKHFRSINTSKHREINVEVKMTLRSIINLVITLTHNHIIILFNHKHVTNYKP